MVDSNSKQGSIEKQSQEYSTNEKSKDYQQSGKRLKLRKIKINKNLTEEDEINTSNKKIGQMIINSHDQK